MVGPFTGRVRNDPALFQKVRNANTSGQVAERNVTVVALGLLLGFHPKLQLGKLPKPAAVVVAQRLGIPKGLKDGRTLQDPRDDIDTLG